MKTRKSQARCNFLYGSHADSLLTSLHVPGKSCSKKFSFYNSFSEGVLFEMHHSSDDEFSGVWLTTLK